MTDPNDPIRTVVNIALGIVLFSIVIGVGIMIISWALALAGFR